VHLGEIATNNMKKQDIRKKLTKMFEQQIKSALAAREQILAKHKKELQTFDEDLEVLKFQQDAIKKT